MGMQAAPEQPFYNFCLEYHVPGNNILRLINDFLNLDDIRRKLKPFYCTIGRPSVDPALMIRTLVIGYGQPATLDHIFRRRAGGR